METQKLSFEKPFEKAHQKFEQLCERLESALSLAMTHGQLERYIHTEGTEVMRQIYQDHLELPLDFPEQLAGDETAGENTFNLP